MTDPTGTRPESPYRDALKHTPRRNTRDAERLYDQPGRDGTTGANQGAPGGADRGPPNPAPSVGTDNPPG